uniref:Uncharacterized protein n=1 Tax=Arundo donax TaxID=35708 RepID=A0A0A9AJ72_ARUDO
MHNHIMLIWSTWKMKDHPTN